MVFDANTGHNTISEGKDFHALIELVQYELKKPKSLQMVELVISHEKHEG